MTMMGSRMMMMGSRMMMMGSRMMMIYSLLFMFDPGDEEYADPELRPASTNRFDIFLRQTSKVSRHGSRSD